MNAKLQAIERAGASITSITQVENFQLKFDAIESKSKAILLPGFQIIDIGYVADGTYQVVLTGKIQTGEQATPAVVQRSSLSTVNEIKRDGRFVAYGNGTVFDTWTNLMWAAKDNGTDTDWQNAKAYCENYRGGGYTDWRMPTPAELGGLCDKGKTYQSECRGLFGGTIDIHATELIRLTCYVSWTSERGSDDDARSINFDKCVMPLFYQSARQSIRVLPVRSGK